MLLRKPEIIGVLDFFPQPVVQSIQTPFFASHGLEPRMLMDAGLAVRRVKETRFSLTGVGAKPNRFSGGIFK